MKRLENKVAIVTGANSGIGKATAIRFAQEGATVVLCARRYELLEEAAAECRTYGVEALAVKADLTIHADCTHVVEETIKNFGRVDILVNNAGISARESIFEYAPQDFKKIMDLNVTAVFQCSKAAAGIMKSQGGGVILNTSSMVSLYGQPAGVGYPASKFAVNGMTKSLARELGRDNIRVNAVAPGVTRTDMVAALPEEMVERISATIPLGRMGEPQDVANAFLFLASDLASYVTGAILSVDGAAMS